VSFSGHLTIDLDAIAANWRALDAMTAPEVETAAVVKADGYGCGAAEVGRTLAKAGARTFFVALPEEGVALRQAIGPAPTIYILGGYPLAAPPLRQATTQSPPSAGGRVREGGRDTAGAALYPAHDLRPVLNSALQAVAWFRAEPETPCAIHLDSGMNRLGIEPDEFASLGPMPESVSLVMSHLACADMPEHPQTPAQLTVFLRLTEGLAGPRSLSATAGILRGQEHHFDLTRPGIGLYGGWPFTAARPVVALDLPIIQIRDLAPGETIGYGASWTAARPSRIATLSSGYADGLIRAMGDRAMGYIDGQPLPFAGRVSMDLITLDVTDCPTATPGQMVEILGSHQSIDDLAAAAGTIGHEILTSLGSRYARRYTGG